MLLRVEECVCWSPFSLEVANEFASVTKSILMWTMLTFQLLCVCGCMQARVSHASTHTHMDQAIPGNYLSKGYDRLSKLYIFHYDHDGCCYAPFSVGGVLRIRVYIHVYRVCIHRASRKVSICSSPSLRTLSPSKSFLWRQRLRSS